MKGTQTHLEFIPERTTDFIFAAFAEEFGLAGAGALVLGFIFLIFRGLMIAAEAPTVFTRLLAGAITLSFFTYAFVNMGMVSGILPVVGRATALHQLRRHGDGDARTGTGHPDVDLEEPPPRAELKRPSRSRRSRPRGRTGRAAGRRQACRGRAGATSTARRPDRVAGRSPRSAA